MKTVNAINTIGIIKMFIILSFMLFVFYHSQIFFPCNTILRPLRPFLRPHGTFPCIYSPRSLLQEIRNCGNYSHRVYYSVELPIFSALKLEKEKHPLCDL